MLIEIINKAHENAVKRNVYYCDECGGIGRYTAYNYVATDYCYVCKGTGKTLQKNIIEKLREEIEELEKAFSEKNNAQPYRVNRACKYIKVDDESFLGRFENDVKDTTGDELADIIIICLAAAKELNIPIIGHLQAKNKYNEVRD